jgi:predicted phage terminase large subunit-like protein
MSKAKGRYEVGYGRPPVGTQFKKNQSGNSKGRPKGSNNLKTDFSNEIRRTVSVVEAGRTRKMTVQQLALRTLTRDAVHGKPAAQAKFFDLIGRLFGFEQWFGSTLASRLNDKAAGSIIVVMQRVHEDDLAGHLFDAGGWDHLNLPAIAREDEIIPLGPDRHHQRRAGDVLHPTREPRHVLDAQRAIMGSFAFEAQYQQAPVPASGNMARLEWFRRYGSLPTRSRGDRVVQSWDCASKAGVLNDFSVCVTALIRGRDIYILHVHRERLLFPDLKKKVAALAARHRPGAILIEDAASGTQLLQELHANRGEVVRPTACKPEGDKASRFAGASNRIEAGEVILPQDAPWLADFLHEVLAFPNGRHDDQCDALSQLLIWARKRPIVISQAALARSSMPASSRRIPVFF